MPTTRRIAGRETKLPAQACLVREMPNRVRPCLFRSDQIMSRPGLAGLPFIAPNFLARCRTDRSLFSQPNRPFHCGSPSVEFRLSAGLVRVDPEWLGRLALLARP